MSTVVDSFLAQVERRGDAVAVEYKDKNITYSALSDRSAELAATLAAGGVQSGDTVGLNIGRGLELPVALLAILRLGAAYLPLDPSYPEERLQFMVRQGRVSTILSDAAAKQLIAGVETLSVADLLAAAGGATAGADEPGARMLHAATASAVAYVIFTSGSTGTPKGVALSHGALANLVRWQSRQPGLGEPARTLQFTPLSFDVHFQEFFGTWCTGGTLVLIDDVERRDPRRLRQLLDDRHIERLFLPFVALQQLVAATRTSAQLGDLGTIVTAGEQLVVDDHLRRFFEQRPQLRLHNHYGPSETHVATAHPLPADPATWPVLPPIGRPIDGGEALILDPGDLSTAEEGELFLGGACVAEGYVGNTALTEQRFVTLTGRPGRFYRTGDRVRRDAAGDISYLGRYDQQVKVRGYRVETGEVEAALAMHPGVAGAIVDARGKTSAERQLIAYITPDTPPPTIAGDEPQTGQAFSAGWREVWDRTYEGALGPAARQASTAEDFTGWNSSFDGRPLPAADMRRWVKETGRRILATRPRRVLEIGAGTGLILFAVAPEVEHYHATDFSEIAVRGLAQAIGQQGLEDRSAVSLLNALDVHELPDSYDTVVINSVTQHLEAEQNVALLIERALTVLDAGGSIFIGDVTTLEYRPLYFAAVERARNGPDSTADAFAARVAKREAEERELVLSATGIARMAAQIDQLSGIKYSLKSGDYENELSQYRVDVTLSARNGSAATQASIGLPAISRRPWEAFSEADLEQISGDQVLVVEAIPNRRLEDALDAHRRAQPGVCPTRGAAADPDELRTVARTLMLELSTVPGPAGTFRAVFSTAPLSPAAMHSALGDSAMPTASKPYLQAGFPALVRALKDGLAKQLPDYMQPARYVLLPEVPLTPSGKLDRRRLPVPTSDRPPLANDCVRPANEQETHIAALWQELLELDQVGVTDNFFELGGSSILSLQTIEAMETVFERELSIVQLFQTPTIRGFCQAQAALDTVGDTGAVDARSSTADRARRQRAALARRRGGPRRQSS
ncbi:MAG: amino acid adenylation domain-containing protein [Pseudomonadota bacterium]